MRTVENRREQRLIGDDIYSVAHTTIAEPYLDAGISIELNWNWIQIFVIQMFSFGFVIRLALIIWYVILSLVLFVTASKHTIHIQHSTIFNRLGSNHFNCRHFQLFHCLSMMFIFVGHCFKGAHSIFSFLLSFFLFLFIILVLHHFLISLLSFVLSHKLWTIFLISLFRMPIESTFNRLCSFYEVNECETTLSTQYCR